MCVCVCVLLMSEQYGYQRKPRLDINGAVKPGRIMASALTPSMANETAAQGARATPRY